MEKSKSPGGSVSSWSRNRNIIHPHSELPPERPRHSQDKENILLSPWISSCWTWFYPKTFREPSEALRTKKFNSSPDQFMLSLSIPMQQEKKNPVPARFSSRPLCPCAVLPQVWKYWGIHNSGSRDSIHRFEYPWLTKPLWNSAMDGGDWLCGSIVSAVSKNCSRRSK